jgi:hypothetical protein
MMKIPPYCNVGFKDSTNAASALVKDATKKSDIEIARDLQRKIILLGM